MIRNLENSTSWLDFIINKDKLQLFGKYIYMYIHIYPISPPKYIYIYMLYINMVYTYYMVCVTYVQIGARAAFKKA